MNGERNNASWIICYSWMIWSSFQRVKNKWIPLWELFMSLVLILGWTLEWKKCGILNMKREKVVRCERINLLNSEVMNEVEKEGYTYLGIVELDKIKENEMKEKTIKEYKRRFRLVLKSKINRKNKLTAINAWAMAVFRYGAGILQ